MKGVIYARYSSDNQREESIEGQLRECKEYAERNDITILGTYIDRALSAKTDNRPEFQHMIKDSAKGLFDVVLVWKLDRFARNRYDSARYKNLLKKNGVKVISARENISEGSEGIILEAMLEGYAEYYSAELSEKVIRGLTDNALKCKYNGGTVPMGYYIDEQQYYQIDPKTAPVVLEMFTKYSEGATMQELVNLLNSRGMRSIRGGKITLNIMNHLLKNRRYMGEYSYRDVVKEDGIPAIVPKELFERVQERLAKNKKAPARHKAEDDYLLTTKLYCGKCGSFMVGESGTSHTMKVHRYYRCVNTKKKKLCDKKAVKKDWIEDLVVNYTMKAIMNDEVMERLIDTLMELQTKESTDLPLLKKQLAETEKGINNMLNAIQAGIFTPSTKQRLDELEETKSQLEVSILQEEMHKPLLTREQIAFFIYRFRKFDVTKREQRQRLIDSFVNAVYLYEDKIILTFNYKDGSKTITLAEVEGSDLSVLGAPIENAAPFGRHFLFPGGTRKAAPGAPEIDKLRQGVCQFSSAIYFLLAVCYTYCTNTINTELSGERFMELWDLYNERRELTGRDHIRGEEVPHGYYHLVVHIWIRNSKGEYLISQRSADRPACPLLWECIGGSVIKGEDSLTGALRETQEEVGLVLSPGNAALVSSVVGRVVNGVKFSDILDVWLFEYDGPVSLEQATTREVAQTAWMAKPQIKELFDTGKLVPTLGYFFETERL